MNKQQFFKHGEGGLKSPLSFSLSALLLGFMLITSVSAADDTLTYIYGWALILAVACGILGMAFSKNILISVGAMIAAILAISIAREGIPNYSDDFLIPAFVILLAGLSFYLFAEAIHNYVSGEEREEYGDD